MPPATKEKKAPDEVIETPAKKGLSLFEINERIKNLTLDSPNVLYFGEKDLPQKKEKALRGVISKITGNTTLLLHVYCTAPGSQPVVVKDARHWRDPIFEQHPETIGGSGTWAFVEEFE